MTNHMAEVAQMLGVELNEEFMINEYCKSGGTYKITGKGLEHQGVYNIQQALVDLITGVLTIKRMPWKPKKYEKYWAVDVDGKVDYENWTDDYVDILLYKIGNCYRTKEEIRWITQDINGLVELHLQKLFVTL